LAITREHRALFDADSPRGLDVFAIGYAEHEPDWCDAELAVLASRETISIWTYDAEFRATWRAPDGSRLRFVPRAFSLSRR